MEKLLDTEKAMLRNLARGGIVRASNSASGRKLKLKGLVCYHPFSGWRLTDSGKRLTGVNSVE